MVGVAADRQLHETNAALVVVEELSVTAQGAIFVDILVRAGADRAISEVAE